MEIYYKHKNNNIKGIRFCMELLQLKYFQTVAQYENMTKAAKKLYIAQPCLSRAISRLEKHIGVPLFDRIGRSIKLNQYGKTFLKRTDRVFKELEEGKLELAALSGQECGNISIGATTTQLLPELLKDYLSLQPKAKFKLQQIANKTEIEQQLIKGNIDLCISTVPIIQNTIDCELLTTEEIFLALPKSHILTSRKNVELAELSNEPFIQLTTEFELRETIDNLCRQSGFNPDISFESSSVKVIFSLVESGMGIALIPSSWWSGFNTSLLAKIKIKKPVCNRNIWLSWSKERYLSRAIICFKEYSLGYFKK